MASIYRAGILAFALVSIAWFALAAHQAVDTSRATALVNGGKPLPAAKARQARSLLGSAATLNPDLTVDLLRGQLAFDQHQSAASERILKSVTRREPLSLAAWSQLAYVAAVSGDHPTLVRAARHISQLYPKLK